MKKKFIVISLVIFIFFSQTVYASSAVPGAIDAASLLYSVFYGGTLGTALSDGMSDYVPQTKSVFSVPGIKSSDMSLSEVDDIVQKMGMVTTGTLLLSDWLKQKFGLYNLTQQDLDVTSKELIAFQQSANLEKDKYKKYVSDIYTLHTPTQAELDEMQGIIDETPQIKDIIYSAYDVENGNVDISKISDEQLKAINDAFQQKYIDAYPNADYFYTSYSLDKLLKDVTYNQFSVYPDDVSANNYDIIKSFPKYYVLVFYRYTKVQQDQFLLDGMQFYVSDSPFTNVKSREGGDGIRRDFQIQQATSNSTVYILSAGYHSSSSTVKVLPAYQVGIADVYKWKYYTNDESIFGNIPVIVSDTVIPGVAVIPGDVNVQEKVVDDFVNKTVIGVIGGDIPSVTDIPNDTPIDIPVDVPGTSVDDIGISLGGITGLLQKILAVLTAIKNFFVLDFDAAVRVTDIDGLFEKKFAVFYQINTLLSTINNYTVDNTPPIFDFTIPTEVLWFGGQTYRVVDFSPYIQQLTLIRTFFGFLLWIVFVLSVWDYFNPKLVID